MEVDIAVGVLKLLKESDQAENEDGMVIDLIGGERWRFSELIWRKLQ